MTKMTSRWLLTLVWNWKNSALPLPCIEKDDSRGEPQAVATSIDASEEQSGQEIQAHARKWSDNIRTTSPKKGMWEAFTMAWYTRQFLFKKVWRYQKPEQPWLKNGINQRQFQFGMSIKWDQSQKSSVRRGRMEKQFSSQVCWTSVTWRTPNLQNNSRFTRGEMCSGRTTPKTKKEYSAIFTEQGASASQVAAANFLGSISKLPWYDWRNKWRNLTVHSRQNYRSSQFVTNSLFHGVSSAGDLRDAKSTSGGLLCVLGSHTFVPISRMCKKQTAVSHSSAESEIMSLDRFTCEWITSSSVLGECLGNIYPVSQPWETLSVTNVKESFRLIHTLTIVCMSQLTMLHPTFPTAHTQPNSICWKTMRQWSKWSTKPTLGARDQNSPSRFGLVVFWRLNLVILFC